MSDQLGEFIRKLATLFVLAAEQPNLPAESLLLDARESTSTGERMKQIGAGGAAGTGLGTVIGGFIGAVAGFFLGGVGAIPGASAGAAIGGSFGAVTGTIMGTFTGANKKIIGKPASKDLHRLAETATAVSWGVSYQGFGKSPELQRTRIRELLELVDKKTIKVKAPDWLQTTKSDMIVWCREVFGSLGT